MTSRSRSLVGSVSASADLASLVASPQALSFSPASVVFGGTEKAGKGRGETGEQPRRGRSILGSLPLPIAITDEMLGLERGAHILQIEAAVATAQRESMDQLRVVQQNTQRQMKSLYHALCIGCQRRIDAAA